MISHSIRVISSYPANLLISIHFLLARILKWLKYPDIFWNTHIGVEV